MVANNDSTGQIQADVLEDHLLSHPHESEYLRPLLSAFGVTWARERQAYNTKLSSYILNPLPYMRDTFGFDTEVALFITSFSSVQPRTFQAVMSILNDNPLRGRVDRSLFILIVPQGTDKTRVAELYSQFDYAWIPVIITAEELKKCATDPWALRNVIAQTIYTRDLFDVQLPLRSDLGFFGREPLLFDLKDAVAKSQNRGLFGLRKTGKTSLLFKLRRNIEQNERLIFIYLDCKKPLVRRMTAGELLNHIANMLLEAAGRPESAFGELNPFERVERVVDSLSRRRRVCLVFDEFEYITYLSEAAPHWKQDYLDFWQTIWALQSGSGNVSFIICGVNPSVVEENRVHGVQNPLFGIVPATYLQGLSKDELRRMTRYFGRRMGLVFEISAIDRLFDEYGGHPLLTRKACSYINQYVVSRNLQRPVNVGPEFLDTLMELMNSDIQFYFEHVLGELREFYSDEFELLEMLVTGQRVDAYELRKLGQSVEHLESYGVVSFSGVEHRFVIRCLETYLQSLAAIKECRRIPVRLVDDRRVEWIRGRLNSIYREMKHLNTAFSESYGTPLFPGESLGSPERWFGIGDVTDKMGYEHFVTETNKCFAEAIQSVGKRKGLSDNYLHGFVREKAPALYDVVNRVRLYRHDATHSELTRETQERLRELYSRDLGDAFGPKTIEEMKAIQQVLLDDLLLASQSELGRIVE